MEIIQVFYRKPVVLNDDKAGTYGLGGDGVIYKIFTKKDGSLVWKQIITSDDVEDDLEDNMQ